MMFSRGVLGVYHLDAVLFAVARQAFRGRERAAAAQVEPQ